MITRIRLIALITLFLLPMLLTGSASKLLAKPNQEVLISLHVAGASLAATYFDTLYTHSQVPPWILDGPFLHVYRVNQLASEIIVDATVAANRVERTLPYSDTVQRLTTDLAAAPTCSDYGLQSEPLSIHCAAPVARDALVSELSVGQFMSKCGFSEAAPACGYIQSIFVFLQAVPALWIDEEYIDYTKLAADPTPPDPLLVFMPGYNTGHGMAQANRYVRPLGISPMSELTHVAFDGVPLTKVAREQADILGHAPRGTWYPFGVFGVPLQPVTVTHPIPSLSIKTFVEQSMAAKQIQLGLPENLPAGLHTLSMSFAPFAGTTYKWYGVDRNIYLAGDSTLTANVEHSLLVIGPSLAVGKKAVAPGEKIIVTGSGFKASTDVVFSLVGPLSSQANCETIVGSIAADAHGAFTQEITIPAADSSYFKCNLSPPSLGRIRAIINDRVFVEKYKEYDVVSKGIYRNVAFVSTPVASPTFIPTASMSVARSHHATVSLSDGSVIAAGGRGSLHDSSEIYNANTVSWTPAGNLGLARSDHTAMLLQNGTVLVAGGIGQNGVLTSTELFTPNTLSWNLTGNLATPRSGHSATLLADGTVLVVGGRDQSGALASAERFNPAASQWAAAGQMATARSGHTATLLPDGKVLVAGGGDLNGQSIATVELFEPSTGTWSTAKSMTVSRQFHTATSLANGSVLVAGGKDINGVVRAEAELFDLTSGNWSLSGNMTEARHFHTATLLPDGTVLVTGGEGNGILATTEVYDPLRGNAGTWLAGGGMTTARSRHTATLLATGTMLIVGGIGNGRLASAELYGQPNQSSQGSYLPFLTK